MSILVVGSVALDSVQTPFGMVKEALGGSGTYFGVSASYFTDVNLVAVIGNDFPKKYLSIFKEHKINTEGLKISRGKTFRWKGRYRYDMNQAQTLDTKLNVFADFKPEIPESYRNSEVVFLANIDPVLQLEVLKQVKDPKIVACDTMNFWIERKKNDLKKVLKFVDILLINEAEVRELAQETNLIAASKKIFSWGPKAVVVKRGEYGALYISRKHIFAAPAYPLEVVYDPTGAGDTFAGGFMGYLARSGGMTDTDIRRAIVFGSVMASYNVEDFSLNSLRKLNWGVISRRFVQFKKLTHFEILK